jgi:hypothetical protein
LQKVGLTPGKDVTIVQIGSTTARVDAAMTGRVQATVVNPPASIIAQKRGMHVLADLPKLGLVYQHTSWRRREDTFANIPTLSGATSSRSSKPCIAFTPTKGAFSAFTRYIGRGVDRDVLEKTWENLLSESVLPRKQYPSLEGIKTILATELKGKPGRPEDFVDSSFVREFDQSGFTDSLYKKR